jgi:molecular chaperone GrpE
MTTRKNKHEEKEKPDPQEMVTAEEVPVVQVEDELLIQEPAPATVAEAGVDVASLQKERDEARATAAEYLDGWQRSMAEFSNYKKRVERDRELVQLSITGTVVKRYLEIADDLERALKTRPHDGDGAAWANGVELIYRKLLAILDSQDVKPMDALGQPFDPARHEAIGHVDSAAYSSGSVAEVVQSGYIIGDRVLRPALVRIAN